MRNQNSGPLLAREPVFQALPRIDGSVHVAGPHTCYMCLASSADHVLDPIFDSESPTGEHHACHDLTACFDRARANAAATI